MNSRRLHTLGPAHKRTEFSYSGSIQSGVVLHHDSGDTRVSARVFAEALRVFAGQQVRGGFQMDDPPKWGFGAWLQSESPRLNSQKLTPRHASFVAAILCNEAGVKSSLDGNAVVLHFPAQHEGGATGRLDALREEVLEANLALVRAGLVIDTFGNASAIAREQGLVVIKPSGVPYDKMTADQLVVTDLEGNIVEGDLRPSSDLPTHLALYKAFATIGGVVHTHSHFATCWAQACREIPCFGTTHADYFHGSIPLTAPMDAAAIETDYEWNTGVAIVRRFESLDPLAMPAVLVAGHAPFCWGRTVSAAAHRAILLEEVARMAYHTVSLNANAAPVSDALRDKHFLRKHGPKAYYGQPK